MRAHEIARRRVDLLCDKIDVRVEDMELEDYEGGENVYIPHLKETWTITNLKDVKQNYAEVRRDLLNKDSFCLPKKK